LTLSCPRYTTYDIRCTLNFNALRGDYEEIC